MIRKNSRQYKNLLITLGVDGLLVKLNNKKSTILSFPALNNKVIDTLGAGDAVFSYTAALVNNTTRSKNSGNSWLYCRRY